MGCVVTTDVWHHLLYAGVEPADVEVAKEILDAILAGHVEGADVDDMEYEGNNDDDGGDGSGLNVGRCCSSPIRVLFQIMRSIQTFNIYDISSRVQNVCCLSQFWWWARYTLYEFVLTSAKGQALTFIGVASSFSIMGIWFMHRGRARVGRARPRAQSLPQKRLSRDDDDGEVDFDDDEAEAGPSQQPGLLPHQR